MRHYRWSLPALGAVLLLAAGLSSAAPPKKCPAGKLVRVIDGARGCAPAKAFRPQITTLSPAATLFRQELGSRLVKLRLKNGRVIQGGIPPALQAAAVAAFAQAEADLGAAIDVARARGSNARGHGVTATPGAPATVTVNPDGSATASGSFSLTSKDQGQTLTADIGIKSSSTGTLDMDIGLSFDGGAGKTVRVGFGGRINSGPGTTCPSATGEVRLDSRVTGKSGSSEKFGAKRVNLGTVHEATTAALRARATAQMGPDARLQPFAFSAGADFDYARSAQVLGFFSSRTRAVGTATMTGTMNPATGQVSNATVTTKIRSSGFGPDTASAEAATRAVVEKLLKEEAGSALKSLRRVEQNARSGGCTKLILSPPSATLAPNATTSFSAQLQTKENGTPVPTVRWAAVPAKGSVAPAASKAAQPTFTATGAAPRPQTARINVKAVSPAGISEGTWIGTEDDLVFPNSYSGTASYSGAVAGITETWQGTVTYTRTSQQANPDGSRQALYALSGVSLSHAASGTCSWNSGPGGTIKAGDIEIQVDAAGTWTSAFLVDVEMPTTTVSCPPAPSAPNAGPIKAFLNSRTVASGLRAMSPQGAIVGTDVADTLATSVLPATASWNLVPGT